MLTNINYQILGDRNCSETSTTCISNLYIYGVYFLAMAFNAEIRFVTVHKPGETYDAKDARAIRRHVQKAVSRNRKTGDIGENFRFFTKSEFLKAVRPREQNQKQPRKQRREDKSRRRVEDPQSQTTFSDVRINLLASDARQNGGYLTKEPGLVQKCPTDSRCSDVDGNSLLPTTCLSPFRLTSWHPFTAYASKHVQLPQSRIDLLFESRKFSIPASSANYATAKVLQTRFGPPQSLFSTIVTWTRNSIWTQSFQVALQNQCF
jgi:hypothetical protein